MFEALDFVVFRAAGSHGAGDILAVHPQKRSALIEVKSTGKDPFYFGSRAKEQLEESYRLHLKGHNVYWLVRYKGGARQGKWRAFPLRWFEDGKPMPLRREVGMDWDTFLADLEIRDGDRTYCAKCGSMQDAA